MKNSLSNETKEFKGKTGTEEQEETLKKMKKKKTRE